MARTESIISRFPAFFQSGDLLNNLYRYVETFGKQVDIAEEDLIRVMRAHWVNTANNEDSKGFNTSQKGDLDKIFALYLEALGGTSLLKQVGRRTGGDGIEDDKIYRERIKGLIDVLRDGASTKKGIVEIVAANLGIVGDSPEAKQARSTIRVEEFLPEYAPQQLFSIALKEEFIVFNSNNIAIRPQVSVQVVDGFAFSLANLTLRNLDTGEYSRLHGSLVPGRELLWLNNGKVTLDGQEVEVEGATPFIGPRATRMRIEGGIGMPAGQFDQHFFDFSRFEVAQITSPGTFDESKFDESVFNDGADLMNVRVDTLHYTPGTFNVRIPWDIPGYSEALEDLSDKPRDQIPYIIQKVKAAGTYGIVTYEKTLTEEQEQAVELTLRDLMPLEAHVMTELSFNVLSTATPYPGSIHHEQSDTLILSGVFDYTGFDTLNTFA